MGSSNSSFTSQNHKRLSGVFVKYFWQQILSSYYFAKSLVGVIYLKITNKFKTNRTEIIIFCWLWTIRLRALPLLYFKQRRICFFSWTYVNSRNFILAKWTKPTSHQLGVKNMSIKLVNSYAIHSLMALYQSKSWFFETSFLTISLRYVYFFLSSSIFKKNRKYSKLRLFYIFGCVMFFRLHLSSIPQLRRVLSISK